MRGGKEDGIPVNRAVRATGLLSRVRRRRESWWAEHAQMPPYRRSHCERRDCGYSGHALRGEEDGNSNSLVKRSSLVGAAKHTNVDVAERATPNLAAEAVPVANT